MITELLNLHDEALDDLERAQKDYQKELNRIPQRPFATEAAMRTVELRRVYARGIFDALQVASKHTILVE